MSGIRDFNRNLNNLPEDVDPRLLTRIKVSKSDVSQLPQRLSDRSRTHTHLNTTINPGNILLALNRCCDVRGQVSWSQLLAVLANVVLKTKRLKAIFVDKVKLVICEMARADLIGLMWKSDQIETIVIQVKGFKKISSAVKFSRFDEMILSRAV